MRAAPKPHRHRSPTHHHRVPHACPHLTCAAWLNSGVGLPLFQDCMMMSCSGIESMGLPATSLFSVSTYARWCLPWWNCVGGGGRGWCGGGCRQREERNSSVGLCVCAQRWRNWWQEESTCTLRGQCQTNDARIGEEGCQGVRTCSPHIDDHLSLPSSTAIAAVLTSKVLTLMCGSSAVGS